MRVDIAALFSADMNKEEKCILVCIQSMWGALEWILPGIKHLRENHGKISVYFLLNRMYKEEFFGGNEKLQSLTEDIAGRRCFSFVNLLPEYPGKGSVDKDYRHRKLRNTLHRLLWKVAQKRFLEKFINTLKPDVVLMDSGCQKIRRAARKMGSLRVGNFLTAPSFSFAPYVWGDKDLHKKHVMAIFKGFDFYLVDNDYTKDFYKKLFPDKQIINIGCPKFDSKWLSANGGFQYESADSNKKDEKKIVILLKNNSPNVFRSDDFSRLLHDIFTVCNKIRGASLVIKPHPRQDMGEVEAIMRQFPELPSVISYEPVMFLADDAKFFIAMPSGIIFDAVLTGLPVFEYFNFPALNARLRRSFNGSPLNRNVMGGMGCMQHGSLTSVFRHENLVHGVDTMEQLEQRIDTIEQEAENRALGNLRKMYPDNAARKTAEVLLAQMEHNCS